jgi:hypothetical protein
MNSITFTELRITFENTVIAIRTDVAAVSAFVGTTYHHMLCPSDAKPVYTIDVVREGNGFAMRSSDTVLLEGDDVAPLMPLLKEEIITGFMRARPELLWLHAGVAEHSGCAVIIPGMSGTGKTTVVTRLLLEGWRLMSDDVAPISMLTDAVFSFPQRPSRRIYPGRTVTEEEVGSLERETITLRTEQLCRNPTSISAIVFPSFDAAAATHIQRLDRGTAALELLRHVRNFGDHLEGAVGRCAELARTVPMFRLCYDSSSDIPSVLRDLF